MKYLVNLIILSIGIFLMMACTGQIQGEGSLPPPSLTFELQQCLEVDNTPICEASVTSVDGKSEGHVRQGVEICFTAFGWPSSEYSFSEFEVIGTEVLRPGNEPENCILMPNRNVVVTPKLSLVKKYNLSINGSTIDGTISIVGEDNCAKVRSCTIKYAVGKKIKIAAHPEDGQVFDFWQFSGTEPTNSSYDSNDSNTTIIVDGNYNLTANFEDKSDIGTDGGSGGGTGDDTPPISSSPTLQNPPYWMERVWFANCHSCSSELTLLQEKVAYYIRLKLSDNCNVRYPQVETSNGVRSSESESGGACYSDYTYTLGTASFTCKENSTNSEWVRLRFINEGAIYGDVKIECKS